MESQRVLELVAPLRAVVGDHPFWTFAAIAIVWTALASRAHIPRPFGSPRLVGSLPLVGSPYLTTAAAAVAVGLYIAIAIWYAFVAPSYYDFAEPTVACIAWLFDRGLPIYHAFDAAERYSHIYGPLAFILPGWFLAAIGPSIVASKAVGVLAGMLSLLVVYRLMRSATSPRRALALTGLLALLCLTQRNASFWIRPDSFSLLFASLSLLLATSARRWLAAVGVGICTGLLANLKLTGPLYALPAFALLLSRDGVAPPVAAVMIAALVAALPFVAFANVSLGNYLTWVRISAGNGLLWSVLRHNIEWTLFLLLPLVPTLPRRKHSSVYAALLVGIVAVAIAASKPGAGPYHLMPFLPAVLYLFALHNDAATLQATATARACGAFLLATIGVASLQQLYFIGVMNTADAHATHALDDLAQFADANPGHTIAMGYANAGERSTLARPAIVFRTGRYPIDAPAVQEFQMSGLDLSRATIDALRQCDVEMWLIPKGATPFDGPNKYPSMHFAPLFPDAFKRAFFESYEHAGDTCDFDVWRCRHALP